MLTTKVGGVGLNLQPAVRVIISDPDWNPSNDDQAICRSHRFGQKFNVNAFRLITSNTVEDKIY